MEAREKLSSISDGLKVLQDGRAGHAPCVKKLTCKLNFANFNFAVQPQPQKLRKFVVCENLPSYGILFGVSQEGTCLHQVGLSRPNPNTAVDTKNYPGIYLS